MAEFTITGEYIELDKLLKASRLCDSGGEARMLISEGRVAVDGVKETRLRRKIRPGMTVDFDGQRLTVH
ncbi:MAG: RNA-binding S4 domain-containing protein [Pontiellaceae bacterium]|jgi:ribosome-associated protein|nr:RNA-binding S4 domain-containing protein [Pontiellaceae bacterium]